MKVDWSFPKQIVIALIGMSVVGAYPLLAFGSDEVVKAVAAGAIIATVNVLLGYAAIEYSFDKSTTTFLKFVLGGMGIRLLLFALILVVLIKVHHYNPAALVGTMGIFYIVFLTLEILFIQKKISIKHQS